MVFRLTVERNGLELGLLGRPSSSGLPVVVAINKQSIGRIEVKPGWADYRLPVSPGPVRVGSNLISLRPQFPRQSCEASRAKTRLYQLIWSWLLNLNPRRASPCTDRVNIAKHCGLALSAVAVNVCEPYY